MASIRRTLSPAYRNRPFQNGANNSPFSSASSHKLFSNGKYTSPLFTVNLRRKPWRRSLYRCLGFFVLGLVLGMTPFGHVTTTITDIGNRDVFFEIKPPHVNVQLDSDNNGDHRMSKGDEVLFDAVSLGVDFRNEINTIESDRYDFVPRKLLIVITPTYNRAMQAYFMNRLSHVLRLVQPPLLWIVVEENAASFETAEMLRKTGVMYRHLVIQKNSSYVKDRGVHQRNLALEHIERHRLDGIVYFADDDNVYTIDLFDSLREIRH